MVNQSTYAVNISIAYRDRSAAGNQDFEGTPFNFLFTPSEQRHCFNVTLIDDINYEVREEFLVNLTTADPTVTISPKTSAVVIDDNDRLTIGWEYESYTVGEADGQLEVCAKLTVGGYVEAELQHSSVKIEGTAIKNKDFIIYEDKIKFPPLSNSSSKSCFNITILKEEEYEGDKNLIIQIVSNTASRLTRDPQTTTVVITDYNVITQQQPSSDCDGVMNLINSSSIAHTCSSEDCDSVICSTRDWILSLLFDGCNREITLNVTDYDFNNISITLSSESLNLTFNHTYNNETGSITLTFRVVMNEQQYYYLLSIDFPLFNLSFPTTAIPVECPEEGIYTTLAVSTDLSTNTSTLSDTTLSILENTSQSKTSSGSALALIISTTILGGLSLLAMVLVITLTILYFILRKNKRNKVHILHSK